MNEQNVYFDKLRSFFRTFKFWLFISFLVFALLIFLMTQIRCRGVNDTINELYTHITDQGHEIVIYEIGHSSFLQSNRHKIAIEVDGEELLNCRLLAQHPYTYDPLYPSQEIVCTKDTDDEYAIRFKKDSDYLSARFSADFKQLIYVSAYEVEIADDLEIVECQNLRIGIK